MIPLAPPSQEGMGESFLAPQGAAPSPPLQARMANDDEDDEDYGHEDNDNNNNDGRCGGPDGHHRLRTGEDKGPWL